MHQVPTVKGTPPEFQPNKSVTKRNMLTDSYLYVKYSQSRTPGPGQTRTHVKPACSEVAFQRQLEGLVKIRQDLKISKIPARSCVSEYTVYRVQTANLCSNNAKVTTPRRSLKTYSTSVPLSHQ